MTRVVFSRPSQSILISYAPKAYFPVHYKWKNGTVFVAKSCRTWASCFVRVVRVRCKRVGWAILDRAVDLVSTFLFLRCAECGLSESRSRSRRSGCRSLRSLLDMSVVLCSVFLFSISNSKKKIHIFMKQ